MIYGPVAETTLGASTTGMVRSQPGRAGHPTCRYCAAMLLALGPMVLLIGPSGAGKTMLAKRLPTILPPLSLAESLETTRIARTIADLGGADAIAADHVSEAIHYRRLDRQL